MAILTQLTPEILVPRLGDYLVEKGLLKQEDLKRALKVQQELQTGGKHVLMGQVLLEMKLISRAALDQAVTEQILQLRTALQETNQQLERRVQERTAELQDALKRLSELNQLKSNIIANVSHEFRTPLTHIKGYLELLITESLGPLTTDQSNALGVMRKSSERLEELIDQLLQFSVASQGEFTLHLTSLDVTSLLENALNRTLPKAKEHDISLRLNIPSGLPMMKADGEKITWVVLQLLDNGIKFTPKNGRVAISAELDGEFVKITITDTGIGIPASRIPELFEPFHQLDGTSTRRFGGAGLGLALVKQIIDAHGSIIRVSSQLNLGTRMEFILPVVPAN
jgi:two-component system sensor histidine kinase BarA